MTTQQQEARRRLAVTDDVRVGRPHRYRLARDRRLFRRTWLRVRDLRKFT